MTITEAALWYAANGFPVFPLSRGKKPFEGTHGFKDATTNTDTIRGWWTRWPDAGIGLATGPVSGTLVIDIDPRNGGDESWAAIIMKNGPVPDTAEQITGGGGRHIFFRDPGVPVPAELAPGVDVKATGGYVVVAPTLHPKSGRRYEWDGISGKDALLNLAPVPGWLLSLLTKHPRNEPVITDTTKFPQGERNNRLTSLAGSMRRAGLTTSAITVALLKENHVRCEPPLSDSEVQAIAQSITRYPSAEQSLGVWPEPIPLEGALPAVLPFTEDLLPESFRSMVCDAAARMSVPLDFPGIVAILNLAGTVGRRAIITPMENDVDWEVVPNLWGGLIARPGEMKSPLIDAVTGPVNAIQADWQAEYDAAMKVYSEEYDDYQLRATAYKQMRIARIKDPEKPLPVLPGDPPEKPILKRIVVNDTTHEALHVILSENPSGVLVCRDELVGWLAALDKAGREDSRAFYLQAWNGDSSFVVDRIGRGTIHAWICVSMLAGIQPGRLRGYLADAVEGGPTDDGLIQRFQLLVWPNQVPWEGVDRPPDKKAAERVEHAFRMLVQIDPERPLRFRFSPGAQKLFNEWRNDLESSKLRGSSDPPVLIAHLSKYRSLMPSLALLFELADRAHDSTDFEVSECHAAQAAAWCEYLESHARRIYSCVVSQPAYAAQALGTRIVEGDLVTGFTARDVRRKRWHGLTTPEIVAQAIETLEESGWIRPAPADPKNGRPTEKYLVNPAVQRA